jgi:hypothetical protein
MRGEPMTCAAARRRCRCEPPVARHDYIWQCRCRLFWQQAGTPEIPAWLAISRWRARWALHRSLRTDLHTQAQAGFRRAFPFMHSKDFYCSNPHCHVKHKVH